MRLVEFPVATAPRHTVPLHVRLGDAVLGRTRNLSADGAFVETALRPAVGSRDTLSMAWDHGVHSCTARVVRHAEDGIALAFEGPDVLFAQMVAEILADTALPPADLRLAGEVPPTPGPATPTRRTGEPGSTPRR